MADSITIKGHEAVSRALLDHGLDLMFGMLGGANIWIVDSYSRVLGGRYVGTSNEAGATLAAVAYAMCSGKTGVVTVTHGPGLANTILGLIEGVKARAPVVMIAGDTAPGQVTTQDIPQRELIVATGAGFEQAVTPASLLADLAKAIRRAEVERRPIVLNVPTHFQWEDIDYAPIKLHRPETRAVVAEGDDIENAVGIIAAARKPIIIAGRGAASPAARAALVRLAERTGALLSTTLQARDLFEGEAFDLGIFGTLSSPVAVDEIVASDCLLVFGAEMNNNTTSQRAFTKGKRVVQCDRDPGVFGRWVNVDAGILGDTELAAEAIISLLDMAEIPASGHRDPELDKRLRAYVPEFANTGTPTTADFYTSIQKIAAAMPEDRVTVTDAGRFVIETFKVMRNKHPNLYYYNMKFGAIGLGVSSAIGASFAAPGWPVLLVSGDGGFMNGGLAELFTAARHNIDLVTVICNDSGYGMEEVEFRAKNMPDDITVVNWPDFAPVAEALGMQGVTVRNAADLDRAIEAIKTRTRPVLIDLKLDMRAMPSLH